MLRRRLHSLQESHSTVLASSEALSATHRKAEAQVAGQLRVRQEELSRTRAQVLTLFFLYSFTLKFTSPLYTCIGVLTLH